MLVLPNIIMELSNVREKKKGTAKCDKWTVTCDIWTAQFKDRTVKCENKKKIKK